MYKLLVPFVAVGLSACGGGGSATFVDTNNVITNTPTGTVLSGASESFSRSGSSYSVASSTTPVSIQRIDSNAANAPLSARQYRLTVGSNTYDLTGYDNATKAYTSSNASLFLNENSANASIINAQLNSGNTQHFGVVGSLTPVANLPATASYTGDSTAGNGTVGEISIDVAGGSDDTSNSRVTLNANFTNSTIGGDFSFSDPSGDGKAGVEINAPTAVTVPINGTINGNTFSANVDLTNLANVTTVNGNPVTLGNTTLDGGFYGPNAENAAAVGLSAGSTGGATNNIVVYTRVIAK